MQFVHELRDIGPAKFISNHFKFLGFDTQLLLSIKIPRFEFKSHHFYSLGDRDGSGVDQCVNQRGVFRGDHGGAVTVEAFELTEAGGGVGTCAATDLNPRSLIKAVFACKTATVSTNDTCQRGGCTP